jgi:DNA-binding CsgD family transcriptional regulator/pimeloyl-ACP methyl ester carboxylesterase
MDAPPVQYVTTSDGFDIAFADSGAGRPVVLLPGPWNNLRLMWRQPAYRRFFEAIAMRYRLIQFDGRGWGLSSRGLGPDHTMQHRTRDLEAVVDRLRLKGFCLISPNHLCHCAVPYTLEHPDQVDGLVLWNPGWNQLEKGLLLPEEELASRSWELLVRTQTEHFGVGDVDLEAARFRESVTREDFFAETAATLRSDLRPQLPSVTVPTLILGTRNSLLRPKAEETWRQLAGLIPGAILELFDDERMLGGLTNEGTEPPAAAVIIQFIKMLPGHDEQKEPATLFTATLSQREIQVLRLIAAGKSNQQIGDELVISLNTVLRHVSNIFAKTGVANRAEAASFAHRHSLI